LTVDAVHTGDGKDHILEINDSPSGFLEKFQEEDMGHVRDLVIEKLQTLQQPKEEKISFVGSKSPK